MFVLFDFMIQKTNLANYYYKTKKIKTFYCFNNKIHN